VTSGGWPHREIWKSALDEFVWSLRFMLSESSLPKQLARR
jgi:hypothetical protein